MAYEKKDVTAVALLNDLVSASLYKVPGGFTTPPDETWTPEDEPTAVALGLLGPDGLDVDVSADDNDKLVWDGNLGKVYTNMLITSTIRFASSEADVFGVLMGEENVTETTGGATKGVFRLRQSADDGYILLGKTDDGRKIFWVLTIGRVDPNVSFTMVNTDITIYEVNVLSPEGEAYILVDPVAPVSL